MDLIGRIPDKEIDKEEVKYEKILTKVASREKY